MPAQSCRRSPSALATRRPASAAVSVRLCVLRTQRASAGMPCTGYCDCTTTPPGQGSSSAPTSQAPVRSSAMTRRAFMERTARSGEQDGTRGRAVQTRKLEWQTHERVAPGIDGGEIEAFDDEHAGAEQAVMHGEVGAAEAFDRQVVHAD